MLQIRLALLYGHHRGDIFQKIHPAFFAFAALPLLVLACRTSESQRHVAALAETRHIARFRSALWAFHAAILAGAPRAPRLAGRHCAHAVTLSLRTGPRGSRSAGVSTALSWRRLVLRQAEVHSCLLN